AGGFIGGAGNAWLGGANLEQGLLSGVISASIGGLMGGVMGGINGGVKYQKQMHSFIKGNSLLGIEDSSSPVLAKDENLFKAQKAWYPDAPMENIKHFTVDNVPENIISNMEKKGGYAATRAISRGGILTGESNVYFHKDAFTSAKKLFFAMGHEFVHVNQHMYLAGVSVSDFRSTINGLSFQHDFLEYAAYDFQNELGGLKLGMASFPDDFKSIIPDVWQKYSSLLDFNTFNFTRTAKYFPISF
ncbi:MAG: RHS repeat-associated core domain-containing protein, partial [Bacteroidales bacterium]|nr:RHS repeat-associated core domain-containing protein [Bacteroidales bacterium]